MSQKIAYWILIILIVANVFIASLSYIASKSDEAFCVIKSDCSAVQKSTYGELFGVKVSLLGAMAFIILLLLYSFALRYREIYTLFVLANVLGTIFSLRFIYLQVYVLKQICSSCMFIDGFMVLIMVVSWYEFFKYKKDYKSLFSYFR